MTRLINGIVAAAWLAAAAALGWVTLLLASPPENSIVDTIVMIATGGGALACIMTAARELKKPEISETASATRPVTLTVRAASAPDKNTTGLTTSSKGTPG